MAEGRWIPNTSDVDTITNSGGVLIERAKEAAKARLGYVVRQILRDNIGVYGYLTDKAVLTAKSYVYGWLVSCHEEALQKAILHEKALVMYIEKNDKFYLFNPKTVLADGRVNVRGGIKMVNFDIRSGINAETMQRVEEQ